MSASKIIIILLLFISSCTLFSPMHREEKYWANNVQVYVRIEDSFVRDMSEEDRIKVLHKKAYERALGLMIVVVEQRIKRSENKELVISRLKSYISKGDLVSLTSTDMYHEAILIFKLKQFENEILKYEQ